MPAQNVDYESAERELLVYVQRNLDMVSNYAAFRMRKMVKEGVRVGLDTRRSVYDDEDNVYVEQTVRFVLPKSFIAKFAEMKKMGKAKLEGPSYLTVRKAVTGDPQRAPEDEEEEEFLKELMSDRV